MNNHYLLTLMDFGTRFIEAIPMKKVDAAATCDALALVNGMYPTKLRRLEM